MPVVNTYYREPRFFADLSAASPALQTYVAEQLTCGDRILQPHEVSIRLLEALGKSMLANVEMDIFAASYQDRVDNQDQICRNVKQFVLEHVSGLEDTNVWLMLGELGHSAEEPSSEPET